MNPKNWFYTVATIIMLTLFMTYLFRGNDEKQKKKEIKKAYVNELLTNAEVQNKYDHGNSIIRRFAEVPRYSIDVAVLDTIQGKTVTITIIVPKTCFDTIQSGQLLNYHTFSEIAQKQANDETPASFNSIGFILLVIGIGGILLLVLKKA